MSNLYFQYINSNEGIFESKYGEIARGYVEEKKSKFISYIFNIKNQDEALGYIDKIKQDNKNARHVVYIYSYILNNMVNIKFSDDGEPQGTRYKSYI